MPAPSLGALIQFSLCWNDSVRIPNDHPLPVGLFLENRNRVAAQLLWCATGFRVEKNLDAIPHIRMVTENFDLLNVHRWLHLHGFGAALECFGESFAPSQLATRHEEDNVFRHERENALEVVIQRSFTPLG